MTQYRLLALDLDGTLLNERSEISSNNQRWVEQAQEAGITVILSTGRGFASALPFAEQLQLNTPMVTANGSEIWRKPHEIHQRVLLNAAHVTGLRRIAERYSDLWFWANSIEGLFNKEKWTSNEANTHWLKFGYYSEDLDVLHQVLAEVKQLAGLEITNSSPFNIEINPPGITKASAVEEVCRMIGCNLTEAVSIGDSLNDLAAIRACGLGIAMGNAQEEVKASADRITISHEEDGVAYAIREFVLKA